MPHQKQKRRCRQFSAPRKAGEGHFPGLNFLPPEGEHGALEGGKPTILQQRGCCQRASPIQTAGDDLSPAPNISLLVHKQIPPFAALRQTRLQAKSVRQISQPPLVTGSGSANDHHG